jgi:hypothetical protein
MTAAIGYDDGNQQKHDNCEQEPTRAKGKWRWQCQVHTGGRQHRYERWPAGLTDNLCAHKVPAEERGSSLIQPSPRATTHTRDQYDKAMKGGLLTSLLRLLRHAR